METCKKLLVYISLAVFVLVLSSTIIHSSSDYTYFDNYSTDAVEWDSYLHSNIVDELPMTFLYGLLLWEFAGSNRMLGFYSGWEPDADAYLCYRFPITGSMGEITGGNVEFDISSTSKLAHIGLEVSYNGTTWDYLGMATSNGHYNYPLSPPAGCERIWWKFEGTGSGLDNLSVSLDMGVSIEEESVTASIPDEASQLLNPYPNPFYYTTSFVIAHPNESDVELSVFDISGHKIETIHEGYMPVGYFDLTWAPQRGLPAGVYFVKLRCRGIERIRKILYLK
ncbi:T9SS type A sorting domain-containing protein [bacterium]|nr:T9SS type A sorting domain-containing protein [bacterium]